MVSTISEDILLREEPRQRSRYCNWLLARRPRGRNSNPDGGRIIHLFTSYRPVLGHIQPPIQWVQGAFSLEVKRPRRDGDHWPPATAEVKNTWIYTSTLPYLMAQWLSVDTVLPYLTLRTHSRCHGLEDHSLCQHSRDKPNSEIPIV
jgi:hypothetical protein